MSTRTMQLLDLRDPLFNGIIRQLAARPHALTVDTVARHNNVAPSIASHVLNGLFGEGVVMPGSATVLAGTPRWVLTEWGRTWALIADERYERLRVRHLGRPYHYWWARGDDHRPFEEHWCDWCAGFYGVPHDITGRDSRYGTHRVGELCHRLSDSCACIDCAVRRNDRTTLTCRVRGL